MYIYTKTKATYNSVEAAKRLGYSPQSLWSATQAGRIPFRVLANGNHQFDRSVIERLLIRKQAGLDRQALAEKMHLQATAIDWHFRHQKFDTLFMAFRSRRIDPMEADDFASWYRTANYKARYPGIVERLRLRQDNPRPNAIVAHVTIDQWLEPSDVIASVWTLWNDIAHICWLPKLAFAAYLIIAHNGEFDGEDDNGQRGYLLQLKSTKGNQM